MVLNRIAEAKGAIPPSLLSVGRAIQSYPLRYHLREAENLEHYWLHGRGANRSLADVVAAYRNWLKNEPDSLAPAVSSNGKPVGPRPGNLDPTAVKAKSQREVAAALGEGAVA